MLLTRCQYYKVHHGTQPVQYPPKSVLFSVISLIPEGVGAMMGGCYFRRDCARDYTVDGNNCIKRIIDSHSPIPNSCDLR